MSGRYNSALTLPPLTPRTTSDLEDPSSYHLAEVLIVETLKLRLTPLGLVVTQAGCLVVSKLGYGKPF